MFLPTLSGTARLTGDPELRFAPSGTAVCKVSLAFNSRKKNEASGQWEDADTFFITGTLFKQAAENATESLAKGMEVVVTGRLKTRSWEDKESGQKRSMPELLIDSIGPSITYATAKVTKNDRNGGGQRQAAPAADDPWASTGGFADEPPF